MPIPKPNKGEKYQQFMDRCISNPTMNSEFPNNEQRVAVCHNQWKRKKPKK